MDIADLIIRRATVDDLPQLVELWRAENLPYAELEKRLTDFQVADDGAGLLQGAIGVQMAARQAHLHSEVYRSYELADLLRARFWERLEVLTKNHGLFRLWTRHTAPFWHGYGFAAPPPELLAKRPREFGDDAGDWTFLNLREEAPPMDLEKEFAVFKESSRRSNDRAFAQARFLKRLATVLAVLLFLGVAAGAAYLMLRQGRGR